MAEGDKDLLIKALAKIEELESRLETASNTSVRGKDDEKEEEARTKDASVEVAAVPLPGAPTPSTAAPSATEADQGLCFQKTLEGNVGNRNCEVNSQ